MRRKKSFLSLVNRLSFEEKLIGAASLVTIVACFLPWYGISSRVMEQWWNGFSNIGYIIGYTVFIIAAISLYSIAAPLFSLPNLKVFEQKMIHLLLHGEASFLLVLLSFVYARYTVFDAPGSSVRFGLYTALIASFIGAVSGYVMWRKHIMDLRKKGIQEDFIHMPRVRNEYAEIEMEPEMNDGTYDEQESLMAEDEQLESDEIYSEDVQNLREDVQTQEVEEAESEVDDIDVDKNKTLEELTSSHHGEHRNIISHASSDEHVDAEDSEELSEKKEEMRFNF